MAQPDVSSRVKVGAIFKSGARTISEGDFTLLHNLTWTIGRLHTDKEYMAKTQFGDRIMAGNLVMSIMGGLGEVIGLYDRVLPEQFGIDLIALLSYEEVHFHNPLQPGDTIRATFEITDVRSTRTPGRGVIKIRNVSTKQGDQAVAEATQVFLFQTAQPAP